MKSGTITIQMPDLINTSDLDDRVEVKNSMKTHSDQRIANHSPSAALLIDDLFGDSLEDSESTNPQKIDDDPFADVSFQASNGNVLLICFLGLLLILKPM